jgi:hypothetical protein
MKRRMEEHAATLSLSLLEFCAENICTTYCMEQVPSSEADRFSATEEIPYMSWSRMPSRVNVSKTASHWSVFRAKLIQSTSYLFQVQLNIFHQSTPFLVFKVLLLWFYSPLLLGLGRCFSFLILYKVGSTPWVGDQPVSRLLPTHRTTQTEDKLTAQTSMF